MPEMSLQGGQEEAWAAYLSFLSDFPGCSGRVDLSSCLRSLWDLPGLPAILTSLPCRVVDEWARSVVVREFWGTLRMADGAHGEARVRVAAGAIRLASDALDQQLSLVRLISSAAPSKEHNVFEDSVRLSFAASLLHAEEGGSSEDLARYLKPFFERSVEVWDVDEEEDGQAEVLELWEKVRNLRWLPHTRVAFMKVLHDRIRNKVDEVASGVYDHGVLDELREWMERVLIRPVLHHVTVDGGFFQGEYGDEEGWESSADKLLLDVLCESRGSEIFDVVTEYPDSLPAIEELSRCFLSDGSSQRMRQVMRALQRTLRQRLLHPGATTIQIIEVYISTINMLRVLDPLNLMVEEVALPIRQYLQGRNDTIRSIMGALVDDQEQGDLYDELLRQDAKPLEHFIDSDDEEGGPGEEWCPALRDALASKTSSMDILGTLVSIYGSKELFVTEYRMMLADRLLGNLDYNTDKSWQNLELLKVRFGEDSMQQCEVMVRDVDESKRVNSRLQGMKRASMARSEHDGIPLDAILVSQRYWPALQTDSLTLHPRMEAVAKEYEELYRAAQPKRKLEWRNQLGVVDVELSFPSSEPRGASVVRNYSVSPHHAAIIMLFEDTPKRSGEDLAALTGTTEEIVTRRMALWINHGIVAFSREENAYVLLEDQSHEAVPREGAMVDDDEEDGGAINAEAQDAALNEVIGQFLVGMLTNLGKLPLERIHNMLKMYMANGEHKYEKSPGELKALLSRLCAAGSLELDDGVYHLPSTSSS